MGFNRILKAFGNLDQILEGVKNKIFKKEDVEHIANVRWMECLKCPALDETGKECAVKGTQPCCSDCGCALGFKLRALSSSCPRKRWNAVTDNQGEAAIKNQIKKDEENASNI
tara:strand:- start:395 stop:733 length:339 start_codon:yes stop_codon:yes gene_type:complete